MTLLQDTPVSEGIAAVKREQDRLKEEITAFEDFHDQVADIAPEQSSSPPTTAPLSQVQRSSQRNSSLETIRTAYQDTVLAVDHWEDAYHETTATESLSNEVSPELAERLTAEHSSQLSPLIKNRLLTEVKVSIESRTEALAQLNAEANRLRNLRDQLDALLRDVRPVEYGKDSFDDRVQRLTAGFASLEELAETYQIALQKRTCDAEEMMVGMVYEDLPTRYPGLATLGYIRHLLERVELRLWAGLYEAG